MKLVFSLLITFNIVFSMPIAVNAEATSSSASADDSTPRFKEWFEKKKDEWKQKRKKEAEEVNQPTFDQVFKAMIPEKASGLVQRSILIAIEQIVSEKSLNLIYEAVNNVYDRYGSYIISPDKIEMFTRNTVDEMATELFMSSYQTILERAHGIATGNLAKWSKESFTQNPHYFNNEYKLYDLMINDVKDLFKNLADPNYGKANAAVTMGFIRSSIVNKLNQASALKFKGENITTALTTVKDNKSRSEKSIPGSRSSVIINISDDPYREPTFTSANVDIPEIDLKEVFAQNPETLKYKLRKPLAGLTHFATQSVLFNIPLFFVTVAMLGLDSAKNPRALDQFKESLEDPVVSMGFSLFLLTNHHVAVSFNNIIKNPKLHFLSGQIGMAAGMLAQSVFTDLWNDRNLRSCGRSLYNPQPENSDSCNKFWNDWILTNKISQYTPAILGLLSTAVTAGILQKYGGAAVKKSVQAVADAQAELAQLMKQKLAEDPTYLKTKEAVKKGANKATAVKEKIVSNEKVQEMIRVAKLKLENARANAKLIQESATYFKNSVAGGLSSLAKGRLGVRLNGLFAIAKDYFKTKADLEAYLLKLKSLKGMANFTLVSIGTNLVFLVLDPFISEPINEELGKSSLADLNIKQFLDNNTLADNYHEMISTFFTHKIALPHEKDFKTIPDIFEAYNTSFNYYINNDFKGYDVTQCYTAKASSEQNIGNKEPTQKSSWIPGALQNGVNQISSWVSNSNDAVKRYLLNNFIYDLNPDCVVKSNFITWLDKYAEAEKSWRTLALSQVITSSNAWSETIANFVTNYETTHDFYDYMSYLIYDYRTKVNAGQAADLPEEEIAREAVLKNVTKISRVPLKDKWNQDEQKRYEGLFPEELGGIKTPEYGDFIIASMACGPDPRQPVSFSQKLKSLSWLPWESVSHLAPSIFSTWQTVKPNSPIVETFPGTSFRYIPPRITEKASILCNEDYWTSFESSDAVSRAKYKGLIEYIFKNTKEEIITSDSVGPHFKDWFEKNSTGELFDQNTGVWPVVKKNYENLMKYHFFPALNDTSLKTACPEGGMSCGFNSDVYLRPNGLIYSGVNELYTYIRTLRKILQKVSEKTKGNKRITKFQVKFEKLAQQFINSIFNTDTKQGASFDYNESAEKLINIMHLYFETLPNDKRGATAISTSALVFQKMNSVVGELEGYKKYAQLTFKKGESVGQQDSQNKTGSAYDTRMKGQKKF